MTTYYYSDVDIDLERQTDGDVKKDIDEAAIVNSLINIIETIQGSRRMLPDFAIDIQGLLFEPIDETTAYYIGERTIEAINVWDDRVEVEGLTIEPLYDENMYRCRLTYKILTMDKVEAVDFILRQG